MPRNPIARKHEVVVIGAGPAGCEIAYRLATAGIDVLVVEKDRLDREKPCGGGIQIKELMDFGMPPAHVIERKIASVRIISSANDVLETRSSGTWPFSITVKRSVYDRHLQQRAARAGASFQSQARVTDIRKNRDGFAVHLSTDQGAAAVAARLVVHAAGSAAARITRRLGIDDSGAEMCVTHHHWLKPRHFPRCLEDSVEMYFLRENPEGYVWIFPKRDVLSVGIGATAASIRMDGIRLKELLADFIASHPVASKRLAHSDIVRTDGGVIRFGMLPRLCGRSAVVLGDAAGLANIVHGGGIYHARKSALIASRHCVAFLKTGDQRHLRAYDAEAREFFQNYEMTADRKLRRVFWSPATLESVVRQGKDDVKIQEAIGIVLNSTRSHEHAYRILERKMLDIIYSGLNSNADTYRDIVNAKLRGVFKGPARIHAFANEILLNDRAKRLRASLGLLASAMFGGNLKDAVNFSMIYEIFHTASLVHDDIMDESTKRRGRRTLHAKYGRNEAIITGDLMLSKCYSLIAEFSETDSIPKDRVLALLDIVGKTGEACCIGQSMDLRMAEKKHYGRIDDYLRMIGLKTASLIEGAVTAGAMVAGAQPEQVRVIARFGRCLGLAFQIIDDSLDLLGGASANKSVMNDLKQGKATPMLTHALAQATPAERKTIMLAAGNRSITPSMARGVLAIYRKYDAIAYAQTLSLAYVEKARKELSKLPSCPAKDQFTQILDVLGLWGLLGQK